VPVHFSGDDKELRRTETIRYHSLDRKRWAR
jgi:hypothetical protein